MNSGLTVVTHSAAIAEALKPCVQVSRVLLIDKLILDVDCYSKESIGATVNSTSSNDLSPVLTLCSDAKLQVQELRECATQGNILIAYEPRLDGICWAQQIGSICEFDTTSPKYIAFTSLRDTDLGKMLANPQPLLAQFPSEWFLMRMCEGTFAANINANLVSAKLPAPLYMQNLYSLYILYKLSTLCEKVTTPSYQIILRDKRTGVVLGEQVPSPGESGGVLDRTGFQPYAMNYEDRAKAEAALAQCTGPFMREASEKVESCELSPGYFPNTTMVFSYLLRNSLLPVGAIFNKLYELYASGRLLYPFGYCERDFTEVATIIRPILEEKKIPYSFIQSEKIHGVTLSTVSCVPLYKPEKITQEKTVSDFVEALAVNAFRRNCKHTLIYDYYRTNNHYFVVRRYSFPNLNSEAKSTLLKLYPNSTNPDNYCAYLHTSHAKDRVPFNSLIGFSTRSPCWIKWFIALHYLLEKGLIAMDGESVCLTKKVSPGNLKKISEMYGDVFKDANFLAFDNIFNNVQAYTQLINHVLARLPPTETTTPDRQR